MQKAAFLLFAMLFFECSGTNASLQLIDSSTQIFFEATTPCGIAIKKILGINADDKSQMMKWELILDKDPKKLNPTIFRLRYEYGMPKQGTRGFMDGSKIIELEGTWKIEKGIATNKEATVITLIMSGSPGSLSFLQADENILHFLDDTKHLIAGSAAWSYTLNRKEPMPGNKFVPIPVLSSQIVTTADTIGIFDGRTPCYHKLTNLHNISLEGCQGIKCQLILLQNVKTHLPSSFILRTIYVGNGDNNIYSITGKWKMMQRTANDATTLIYQLKPDSNKPDDQLLLLKGDDNILYFVDNECRLLVGNSYLSYTLNRKK
jgi:hypothetical protein